MPTTSPTASPARSTWRSGTSAARWPVCRSPRCSGLAREKIPAYATARNIEPTPEDVFKEAAERKAQGYHGFKIQFWDGLDRDIPRFRAAREAVGDGYPLMQDAAGMYTYTQALAAGKVLGELDYEWFEEPIPDRNLFQLQRLTDQLDVPILAGETSRVHELAEMIRMGACDIARGDVHMKEGITGLHKAAGMADLLGLRARGPRHQPAAPRHGQPPRRAVDDQRALVGDLPPDLLPRPQGRPARHRCRGATSTCRRAPGLGVELDWDWLDDNTRSTRRTPAA